MSRWWKSIMILSAIMLLMSGLAYVVARNVSGIFVNPNSDLVALRSGQATIVFSAMSVIWALVGGLLKLLLGKSKPEKYPNQFRITAVGTGSNVAQSGAQQASIGNVIGDGNVFHLDQTQAPPGPADLAKEQGKDVKHERDVRAIELLFSRVSVSVCQECINQLNTFAFGALEFECYQEAIRVVENPSFHIYDRILSETVQSFLDCWRRVMNPNIWTYQPSRLFEFGPNVPSEMRDAFNADMDQIQVLFSNLVAQIHENCTEIDFQSLDRQAYQYLISLLQD